MKLMRRTILVASLAFLLALGSRASLVVAAEATSEKPVEPTVQTFQVGKDVYVRSLAIDRAANALWVGTSLGAVNVDLATLDLRATYTREHGLANEYVFALGVHPEGTVWFGTNAGGASTLSKGQWKTYFPMHGLADYWVYCFAFDKAGRVWIGTWDGASLFDPRTGTFQTYRKELINIWVYGLDIDAKGQVWFGTEGGVSMFDGANWRSWTHDDGLGAPNALNLPHSENTALGTRSRHDLNVESQKGETYNPNYVFAAKVDNRGRGIWFGTWGGGVSLFDGKDKWVTYTTADGLAGNIVYSIAQDDEGVLWFGTNHGVTRFDGATWKSDYAGLADAHVYAIAIDPTKRVWLGTKGAVIGLTPTE